MAPVPLEGHQTPVNNTVGQEGSRGGSISLAMLIDFIVQRTYHELTVLAELLVLLSSRITLWSPKQTESTSIEFSLTSSEK
jgi:hypothetical protein